MITGSEATNVLINVCKGTYTIRAHSTIVRTFKPSYSNDVSGFLLDKTISNEKILMPYVPHEWINK